MSGLPVSAEAIYAIERVRALVLQRQKSMFGCDYKAKTLVKLSTFAYKLDRMLSFINYGFYALAHDLLIEVCAVKLPILGRILKGADDDILPREEFVSAATLAINNLRSKLAPDLERLIAGSGNNAFLCLPSRKL